MGEKKWATLDWELISSLDWAFLEASYQAQIMATFNSGLNYLLFSSEYTQPSNYGENGD
jgi:hypothetical protein